MSLEACHPALRIFDVVLAKSFYLQWLGFHLDWEHRPEDGGPSIMEVSRDKAVLHLTEHLRKRITMRKGVHRNR
jgi:hypothetical protein